MMKALEPHTDPKLMAIPLVLFRSYCEECHSNYLNRYGDDPDLVQRQGIAAFAPKIFERLSYESIDAGKGGPGVRAMPAGDKTVVPNEARAAMLNGVLPFLAEPRPTPLRADDLKSY